MREITFAISIVALVGAIVWGGTWLDNAEIPNPFYRAAQAAEPAAPISDNCEEVATVGLLDVYLCEMPYGPDVLINSFGFMLAAE